MGCLFTICSNGYQQIPEQAETQSDPTKTINESAEFEDNHPAVVVSNIDLKFINKSRYETKYVWISPKKKTIHMSDYPTKERRHKEASLSEVTSLVAGPPVKSKSTNSDPSFGKKCLTINFQKGGGIDLKFETENERDVWYALLNKIVLSQAKFIPSTDENKHKTASE
jgi:hypothetical protein